MSKPKLLAAVLAMAHLTCAGVPLTAPANSTLSLNVNPAFVAANGGVSAVTAIVVEPAGTFVPDGTVVFFITDLGRIDPQAKTKDGFAYASFVADSRSGTATIRAFSGGSGTAPTASPSPNPGGASATPISDSKTITVGSANPTEVRLTANPPRITEPRNTELTANVYDKVGNPVVNVPVIFTISAVPSGRLLQESLDSGSQPRFTDTNGQARDTLRTSQNRADAQKVVTITASVPVGASDATVDVAIN